MMKRLIAVCLIIFFGSIYASAKCASGSLDVWPKTGTLPQNPIIILEGYGTEREAIENINNYELYMTSETDTVLLEVMEINRGEFEISQAVLRPARPLLTGQVYTLSGDAIAKEELKFFDWKRLAEATWTITDKLDTTPPVIESAPKFIKSSVIYYGCGPEVYSILDILIDENNQFIIEARVSPVNDSAKPVKYYVPLVDELLYIGHGMCSGAFDMESEKPYLLELRVMDSSGNKSVDAEPVTFISPKLSN